jgi:hypothetical protein
MVAPAAVFRISSQSAVAVSPSMNLKEAGYQG